MECICSCEPEADGWWELRNPRGRMQSARLGKDAVSGELGETCSGQVALTPGHFIWAGEFIFSGGCGDW